MWLLEPDVAYAFPNGEVTILSVMPTAIDSPVPGGSARDCLASGAAARARLSAADRSASCPACSNYACATRRPAAPGLALVRRRGDDLRLLWTGCSFAFQALPGWSTPTAPALLRAEDLDPGLRRMRRAAPASLWPVTTELMSDYADGRGFNPVDACYTPGGARPAGRPGTSSIRRRRMSVRKFLPPNMVVAQPARQPPTVGRRGLIPGKEISRGRDSAPARIGDPRGRRHAVDADRFAEAVVNDVRARRTRQPPPRTAPTHSHRQTPAATGDPPPAPRHCGTATSRAFRALRPDASSAAGSSGLGLAVTGRPRPAR